MPPKVTTGLLKELRSLMKTKGSVQAYIVPSCDAHNSEFLSPADERRAFLSGFTGSNGTAVVTETQAHLWTDSRYTLQGKEQLDENWKLMLEDASGNYTTSKKLHENLTSGSTVGVDPFLIDYHSFSTLLASLRKGGHRLIPVKGNLVDSIWKDKPSRSVNKVELLAVEYTGLRWQEKLRDVQEAMKSSNTSAVIVTALDEVAWLFNLRGSDIPFNPVFFSYAVITFANAYLLMDATCLTPEAKSSIEQTCDSNTCLQILPYDAIEDVIQDVLNKEEGRIWIDPKSNYALVSMIPEERRFVEMTPIALMKGVKNAKELEASKRAHLRDAVALCELFCWMSKEIGNGNITEQIAADKLEEFKRTQTAYVGPSFETISSSGLHGAIIHYRVTEETNKQVTSEDIFLLDSGSQYCDGGTTDVTRTLHFGSPSNFEKKCYTLVLKGVIALTTAVFPPDVTGIRLDSFARQALWKQGLDYGHGTGHGVGAYLNVHEGPMGISYRPRSTDVPLAPGMILSIEPGYYEDGKFGIRLENLAFVKEVETPHSCEENKFLTFETLTMVPYQKKMIDISLLDDMEIHWINDYHKACREIIGKIMQEQGKTEAFKWLVNETEPIGK